MRSPRKQRNKRQEVRMLIPRTLQFLDVGKMKISSKGKTEGLQPDKKEINWERVGLHGNGEESGLSQMQLKGSVGVERRSHGASHLHCGTAVSVQQQAQKPKGVRWKQIVNVTLKAVDTDNYFENFCGKGDHWHDVVARGRQGVNEWSLCLTRHECSMIKYYWEWLYRTIVRGRFL